MPSQKNSKTILVAPLDWGLGHATRCIPLIRELQQQGCTVLVAASGTHAALLQQEFPGIEISPIQGYQIRYGQGNLVLQLFRQLPRFLQTIRREQRWLQQLIAKRKVDGVISDNRYGLHANAIPTVFITHQLQVQAPHWLKWLERPVQKNIYRFIHQFSQCWVPDDAKPENSLAKQLSHPAIKPNIPVQYIGWLTRFQLQPSFIRKRYRLLISLSGPEPQRTVLEKMIRSQLTAIQEPVMLIRGLPGSTKPPPSALYNVTVVNHLSGQAMQQAIAESEIFLSRCGYSTLMDLQTVSCKCIFVPTPGQTEQEYLGQQIADSGKAVVVEQKKFNLPEALQKVDSLPAFSTGTYYNNQLPSILSAWLATLS